MAGITSSPLPALNSPQLPPLDDTQWDAYTKILQAEAHVAQQQASRKNKSDTVSVRVVGFLLLEFLARSNIIGNKPSKSLIHWITSPPQSESDDQHDVVIKVGELCRDKFIRAYRTSNRPYSQPSSHPSSASYDELEDMIKDSMEPTGKDYKTSRKYALARDDYRCMVTGLFNENSLEKDPVLEARATRERVPGVTVHTCHIMNESLMQGIDPEGKSIAKDNKTHYAAGTLTILEMFGFSEFTNAFKEAGRLHELRNLLSLEPNIHKKFDDLNLWFESTGQPDRYKICVLKETSTDYIYSNFKRPQPHVDGAPMVVEFTSQYANLPLPDPLLLELHAMCARVCHMSGAAEFCDQIQRDVEKMKVLAFDGSSAGLLHNLVSLLPVNPCVAVH